MVLAHTEFMRVVVAVGSVAIVVGYAIGSGLWVSAGDSWYRTLQQPPWQPPDWVFGVIWPYNFAALIAAGIAVAAWGTAAQVRWWLAPLVVSVVAALAWARLFYVAHALWPAAIALCFAAVVNLIALVAAWNVRTWAGAILVPYGVWVALAASLSVGYALRN